MILTNMTKKICLVLILLMMPFLSKSQDTIRVISAKVESGSGLETVSPFKIDAAFNIIDNLLPSLDYITEIQKDSLKKELLLNDVDNEDINFSFFYDSLHASYAAIVKINRLKNILGLNLTLQSKSDSLPTMQGQGWALLKYRDYKTEEALLDPAILNCLQMAYSDAVGDSLIFHNVDSNFRIYPHNTIVVGGLNFIGNDKFVEWQLFDDKVVTSYDAVENIFDEIRKSNSFVPFDVETRDTLYSLFNMYGIENYDAPTQFEIKSLNEMMVDLYLTGEFERVSEGANLKLHICRVTSNGLEIKNTVKGFLEEDSIAEYRKLIRLKTQELIKEYFSHDR